MSFNLSGFEDTEKSLSSLGIQTTGDKIRFFKSTVLVDNGDSIVNIPCYFNNSAYGSIWINIGTNTLFLTVGSQYRVTNNVCRVVLQYTK